MKCIYAFFILATLVTQLTIAQAGENCVKDGKIMKKGDEFTVHTCYTCTCQGDNIIDCFGKTCPYMRIDSCYNEVQVKKGDETEAFGHICVCEGNNRLTCKPKPK